jgi:5,10-methylenetetrahydrofolate reductase
VLPTSLHLLHRAAEMKQAGVLAPDVELWAAANPVIEPCGALVEAKADAGATTILTQPPLAWEAFQAWMVDLRRRELHKRCRICIGAPMLSSPANLKFWIGLCTAPTTGVHVCRRVAHKVALAQHSVSTFWLAMQ